MQSYRRNVSAFQEANIGTKSIKIAFPKPLQVVFMKSPSSQLIKKTYKMAYLHSFYQSRFTMKSPSGRGIFPQIRSKRFSFIFGGLEVCRCVRSRLLCRLFAGISHSTLHTLHFTLHTQHYALRSSHSTIQTSHSALLTFRLHTPHSSL